MNIPGFTAEVSLHKASEVNKFASTYVILDNNVNAVNPQLMEVCKNARITWGIRCNFTGCYLYIKEYYCEF